MTTMWTYFRSTPFGELLTGTAHQSHPTDVTAPLHQRFVGKTILAIHVALDRAATVRVTFLPGEKIRLSGIRDIKQRASTEFTDVIRTEAAAARAEWAVIVMATGWQAVLGHRAARPEPGEAAAPFARYKLMFETPEVVVPRAQVDRVYTAIDHPLLDKSVVFSLKRKDVEQIIGDVRKCGLGIAAVRIAVAAQLESWFAMEGEAGLKRDLLLSDGLSALLLNVSRGDFVPPDGATESDQPRQSVQRPAAIEEDLSRFIAANATRSVTFLGPEELCAAVKKHSPHAEIVRPPNHPAHDTQNIALLAGVRHDLNFEAHEVRPAFSKTWRRATLAYLGLCAGLLILATTGGVRAARTSLGALRLEKAAEQRTSEQENQRALIAQIAADYSNAAITRSWVSSTYHAQRFCYAILREMPATAALDKLNVEFKDGQIALSFIVLGDSETQLTVHRSVERAINGLKYKIGSEDGPTGTGNAHAVQYRMHIIVPDAGEVGA